jgi:hypothetical protein
MNPPNSSRPASEEGRKSGGDPAPVGSPPRSPDLVDRAAIYNDLIRILIVTVAAVALIWVLIP